MNTVLLRRPFNPSKRLLVKERLVYLRRIRALGWTQNEAARQIGKAGGPVSRWLRGEFSSAPIRLAMDARLAAAEAEYAEPAALVGNGTGR